MHQLKYQKYLQLETQSIFVPREVRTEGRLVVWISHLETSLALFLSAFRASFKSVAQRRQKQVARAEGAVQHSTALSAIDTFRSMLLM